MSYQQTPDGNYAEATDETHSQPKFVGRLAMTLLVLAVVAALLVIIAAMTHSGA